MRAASVSETGSASEPTLKTPSPLLEHHSDRADGVADPAPRAGLAGKGGDRFTALGLPEASSAMRPSPASARRPARTGCEVAAPQAGRRVVARDLFAPPLGEGVKARWSGRGLLVGDCGAVHVRARDVRRAGLRAPRPRGRPGASRRTLERSASSGSSSQRTTPIAPPRGRSVRPSLGDGRLGHAVLGEVAVAPLERVNLVGSIPVTKLVDQRAADEAGCSRDQDIHGRRVYWRACALLAAVLVAGGCNEGKRRASPPPPQTRRSWRSTPSSSGSWPTTSRSAGRCVIRARPGTSRAQARETSPPPWRESAETPRPGVSAKAKARLVAALERAGGLAAPPGSKRYQTRHGIARSSRRAAG